MNVSVREGGHFYQLNELIYFSISIFFCLGLRTMTCMGRKFMLITDFFHTTGVGGSTSGLPIVPNFPPV